MLNIETKKKKVKSENGDQRDLQRINPKKQVNILDYKQLSH